MKQATNSAETATETAATREVVECDSDAVASGSGPERATIARDELRAVLAMLDTLARGLEARIPGARSFVRIGLDAPAV